MLGKSVGAEKSIRIIYCLIKKASVWVDSIINSRIPEEAAMVTKRPTMIIIPLGLNSL